MANILIGIIITLLLAFSISIYKNFSLSKEIEILKYQNNDLEIHLKNTNSKIESMKIETKEYNQQKKELQNKISHKYDVIVNSKEAEFKQNNITIDCKTSQKQLSEALLKLHKLESTIKKANNLLKTRYD